jgi:hypothetical protein
MIMKEKIILKKNTVPARGMAQVVESLLSKHKAMS